MTAQSIINRYSRHWIDLSDANAAARFRVGTVEINMKKGMDAFTDKWFSFSYAKRFLLGNK